MKKTGLKIVEMIAKGKAPKKIYLICDEAEWELVDGNHYCYQKAADDIYDLDIMEHLNDEFEIIEENKVWKPKYNQVYFYINFAGEIVQGNWIDDSMDKYNYDTGNCFKTKLEGKKEKERKIIKKKLERYAEEHNTEKIDWTDEYQNKWSIYNLRGEICIINEFEKKYIGQVYFTSEKLAEQAIKEIGEDNIKKLFEE